MNKIIFHKKMGLFFKNTFFHNNYFLVIVIINYCGKSVFLKKVPFFVEDYLVHHMWTTRSELRIYHFLFIYCSFKWKTNLLFFLYKRNSYSSIFFYYFLNEKLLSHKENNQKVFMWKIKKMVDSEFRIGCWYVMIKI